MSTVLVTGGSGLVGSHCILQLLSAGHDVRATVRSLAREGDVRAMLKEGGVEPGDRLSFIATDLESDAGWPEAVVGCDYVLHVASPFPCGAPRHQDELIIPARDGTLRVLRASHNAGVKRVVVTSSFAAVCDGHKSRKEAFDETDWADLESGDVGPYVKSKTLAERAAWEFIAEEGDGLELSVINPVAVLGPTLGPNVSTSLGIVKSMLDGAMPGCPRIHFGVVDVRDVVDLHIRVMTHPLARGERFIASAGDCISLYDVAKLLKSRMDAHARNLPRFQLPDWLLRLAALRDPRVKEAIPHLGVIRNATSEKAKRMLGWAPRSKEEAIVASAESLVKGWSRPALQ
jgi:nucleoside-diphosphate-sugar epimerase